MRFGASELGPVAPHVIAIRILPLTSMTTADRPSGRGRPEDDPLVAEQNAFLAGGSRPAAKVIRLFPAARKESDAPVDTDNEGRGGTGPEWYRSMRGVRFQLDDLEDQGENITLKQDHSSLRQNERVSGTGGLGQALMGDVIERKPSKRPPVFAPRGSTMITRGFPAPRTLRRLKPSSHEPLISAPPAHEIVSIESGRLDEKTLMEEIDRENTKKLEEMSEDEILKLQRSLQESLSPSMLELLQTRHLQTVAAKPSDAPIKSPQSDQTPKQEPPESNKRAAKTVVFDTNVDDQAFDNHLRSFFPSETISVSQPKWTIPVHPAEETFYSSPDNAHPQAPSMRFDFNGKYIPPTISRTLPTYLGLHHHALDPGAAGYTVSELSILARSTQPSQKCIALKIIGFLLADVAGGKYDWDVVEELWDEIERERIVEILLDVAKGGRDVGGNRSVLRYAEDAVTRWVDAGGPKVWEDRLRKRGYEKVDAKEDG